jgi:very-short-patch-repair endonuclease
MGYPAEKVAVEYDGSVHVGDRRQMEIDAVRRRALQEEGWLLITVTADQLAQVTAMVRSVEAALVLRRAALRG